MSLVLILSCPFPVFFSYSICISLLSLLISPVDLCPFAIMSDCFVFFIEAFALFLEVFSLAY